MHVSFLIPEPPAQPASPQLRNSGVMAKSRSHRLADSPRDSANPPAARSRPLPLAGIRRLRDTLSFKSTRSAIAEKEILKRENRCTRPLTQKNIDTFLIEQDQYDARHLVQRTREVQVSEWLQQLP